jgi:2-polyprenyl-3-methyl-5-hydroxy-6-metoxy-1,4-benzoquinol methylase
VWLTFCAAASDPVSVLGRDLDALYGDKASDYFAGARRDYVDAMPDNPEAAVLELGCGAGGTGALALKAGKAATWVGIEMFEPMALEARGVLTTVHVGDVETMVLPYAPATFDVLVCSEVLEHLTNPDATLRRLVELVKPGGRIYASVPNVSHWRIVLDLLRGRFDYRERGAMDRTHLRWFTPRSFRALFEGCGVAVDHLAPIGSRSPLRPLLSRVPLEHMLWFQIDLWGRRVS